MAKSESELRAQLVRLEVHRQELRGSIEHVRELLDKADERRAAEGERRWNRVLDNLEAALDVARSKLTACEQQIKETDRRLHSLRETGAVADEGRSCASHDAEAVRPAAALEDGVSVGSLEAAERVLALPVEQLGDLTLDQLAELHSHLFEGESGEEAVAGQGVEQETAPPEKSALSTRIEEARRRGRHRVARARHPAASFVERRKQQLLRGAIGKATADKLSGMTLEEIELILDCHKALGGRESPSDGERQLLSQLESHVDALRARLAELHRERVRRTGRRKP